MESDIHDLPPSCKLVYKTLEYEGRATQAELADETRLNRRTTRYALTRLENAGIVGTEPDMMDLRQTYYSLTEKSGESIEEVA